MRHHEHHNAGTAGLAARPAAALDGACAAHFGLIAGPDVQTPGSNPASAENETADTVDCAGQTRQAQDLSHIDKTRAKPAALLAIKGLSLHELADGSYLADRRNRTRPLRDLHVVQDLARQVGATP